jgi:predicted nucleic acid-binding protein
MSVAMIEHHDIDTVLSFDDDFDGVVDRLAPERLVD